MNYYYITGTSRGLGKAFAEYLLKNPQNYVIGVARHNSIEHAHYKHIELDLSDLEKVKLFAFEQFPDAEKIMLINNAGTLGEIKAVGNLADDGIISTYNTNLIAPAILSNKFIAAYKTKRDTEKMIVNISSGAAKHAVDGWSLYCSSKAALDMFSLVIDKEQNLSDGGFTIYSVSPGILDTAMQEKIRTVSKSDFSRVDEFVNYKKNSELLNPDFVSEKFFRILSNLGTGHNVLFSLSEL